MGHGAHLHRSNGGGRDRKGRRRVYGATTVASLLMASLIGTAAFTTATGGRAAGWASVSSSPPDRTTSSPQVTATERTLRRAPALPGVFTTDPVISANSVGGSEPSIAVNPANPNQIAISRFTFRWNNNSGRALLHRRRDHVDERGHDPTAPGVGGTAGCPCDQTFDYGRDGRLYGTFLTASSSATTIVTGSTTNITNAASWSWNGESRTADQRVTHGRRPAMAVGEPRSHGCEPRQRVRGLRRFRGRSRRPRRGFLRRQPRQHHRRQEGRHGESSRNQSRPTPGDRPSKRHRLRPLRTVHRGRSAQERHLQAQPVDQWGASWTLNGAATVSPWTR